VRFLLDQDIYESTARFLRHLGHDVLTAHQAGLAAAEDARVLTFAKEDNRILVTRDRHFGYIVFHGSVPGGVLYLRLSPSTLVESHEQIAQILNAYSEESLRQAFVTIEPGRHRFRKIKK
jgi:predicted nuclease of predicted toxin-antitoxin system